MGGETRRDSVMSGVCSLVIRFFFYRRVFSDVRSLARAKTVAGLWFWGLAKPRN